MWERVHRDRDRLDADALRACRVFATALRPGAPWSLRHAVDPVLESLGARLAERLNAEPSPDTAEPFLAIVGVGSQYGSDTTGRERTKAAVGAERYDTFMASLASLKPRGGAARKLKQ